MTTNSSVKQIQNSGLCENGHQNAEVSAFKAESKRVRENVALTFPYILSGYVLEAAHIPTKGPIHP